MSSTVRDSLDQKIIYLTFPFQTLQKVAGKEMLAYSKAGSVAEEVLSAVRIVAAYCGEQKEVDRYTGRI